MIGRPIRASLLFLFLFLVSVLGQACVKTPPPVEPEPPTAPPAAPSVNAPRPPSPPPIPAEPNAPAVSEGELSTRTLEEINREYDKYETKHLEEIKGDK